jgi:hypothetical protein
MNHISLLVRTLVDKMDAAFDLVAAVTNTPVEEECHMVSTESECRQFSERKFMEINVTTI